MLRLLRKGNEDGTHSMARSGNSGHACRICGGCGRRGIHLAVQRGDIKALQRYLDGEGDPNCPDQDGSTLLHDAAMCGYEPLARALLKAGANVNARNVHGYTALHKVCANSRIVGHMANVLLDGGADINARTLSGWTALHAAASGGSPDVIKLLVQKGVAVNVDTKYGK
jgi:uncharacterized protein